MPNANPQPLPSEPPPDPRPTAALPVQRKPDGSPEAALAQIAAFDGPVLVDLDETLYLRNSTEDFLDSATPGLLALLLLRVLDALRPWRFSGGEATRDAWRVRTVKILLPWVGMRWRARVKGLAAAHVNGPLMSALLGRREPPIIVTAGFLPIVSPLIAALGLQHVTVVAARGLGFADRRRGKLHMAVEALSAETVHKALVITDSEQDRPLLSASALPLHIVWSDARFRRAHSRVYLPGEYLTQVKRPGERYIFRGILQEDFAYWVLSSIALAVLPALFVVGLLFLLLSFWAVYELGYVDNDRIANNFEDDPKLTAAFFEQPVATPRWQPWVWAVASGAAAIYLLRWPTRPDPLDFVKWLGVLLATHACFHLYNRLDKSTRIWIYPVLQFARSAALVALVPILPIAAAALSSQVLARWVPYYVYRLGKDSWPKSHTLLLRVVFFVISSILLGVAEGPHAIWNWTAAAILAWSIFRARNELLDVVKSVKRLDRGGRA